MTDNTTPAATAETLPYKNPDLPAGERIADLLSRMTLEEKVGQMMQLDARGGDLEDFIVNSMSDPFCIPAPRIYLVPPRPSMRRRVWASR